MCNNKTTVVGPKKKEFAGVELQKSLLQHLSLPEMPLLLIDCTPFSLIHFMFKFYSF